MPTRRTDDGHVDRWTEVEIQGKLVRCDVTDIGSEAVVRYFNGKPVSFVRYKPMTLSRAYHGVTSDLVDWWNTVLAGGQVERDVSITTWQNQCEVSRTLLYSCVPAGYQITQDGKEALTVRFRNAKFL